VIADQFHAERLYNREQIESLPAKVGFEAVRLRTQIETESWAMNRNGSRIRPIGRVSNIARRAWTTTAGAA